MWQSIALTLFLCAVACAAVVFWIALVVQDHWNKRPGLVLLKPDTHVDRLARSTPFIALRWFRLRPGEPMRGPYITRSDFRKLKEMK